MSASDISQNPPVQGIRRDVRSDVQQISQLLSEYLEGFAFLKELIQNADDAGATEMLVAWHGGGGPSAPHSLLRGPGLLVVNNGPFRDEHMRGIRNLGLGTSGGDAEKIGRFGLGVKSVFHVCEAFFLLENTSNPELRTLFNPWSPDFHQEWDSAPGGWNAVWEFLDGVCRAKTVTFEWREWFALWIPLRRMEHAEGPGAIRQNTDAFPGEQESCPESLLSTFVQTTPRIVETLILLKRLRRIHLQTGSQERLFEEPTEKAPVATSRYIKEVWNPQVETVARWQNLPKWPRVFSGANNDVTGMLPDKAKWDASAVITVSKDTLAAGHLRAFWSVYLPVGNAPELDVMIPGLDGDIHIFLHGCFFLNRSRTEVLGVRDGFEGANELDESGIRIAWNQALATDAGGLLPLLIPALDECFTKEKLPEKQIASIIEALQNSALFQIHRSAICQQSRFGRYLIDGLLSWRTIEAQRDVMVLPSCGMDLNEVEHLIAKLLTPDRVCVRAIEGSAELWKMSSEAGWTTERLEALAIQIVDRPFEQSERKYLRSIIVDHRFPLDALEPWSRFAIFEIRSLSGDAKRPASLDEIQNLRVGNQIFSCAAPDLSKELVHACPGIAAWIAETSLPPGVALASLDSERVAALVLGHETLGIASHRTGLLSLLSRNTASSETRCAARYLLHGSSEHRSDMTTTLFIKGGEWESPICSINSHLGQDWACINSSFSGELSEHVKGLFLTMDCDAHAFRNIFRKATFPDMLDGLKIGQYAAFLIGNFHGESGDDELLRRLPIHRFGAGLFTSVEDGVWLAPLDEPVSHNAALWGELKSRCRIVERYSDQLLSARQSAIFEGRTLDRDGVIRLCATQLDAPRFGNLILECLSHRTPSREAADALRQSAWLPLKEGGSCRMDQVIWIEGVETEIDDLLSALPIKFDLVGRSELAVGWESNWATVGWRTMSNRTNPLIPCEGKIVKTLEPVIELCIATHLGIVITDPAAIRAWSRAVNGNEADFSPAARFVQRIANERLQQDPEAWACDLCNLFFRRWDPAEATRYDDALEALRVRHTDVAGEDKTEVERVFHEYLTAARDSGRWATIYREDPDFLLLNARGVWTPITNLATDIPGISRSAILHPAATKALKLDVDVEPVDFVTQPGASPETVGQDYELMSILGGYAEELGERLNRRHWGLFLALLGDNVRDLAPEFLEAVGVDSIRIDLAGARETTSPSDPRIRLVLARYRCRVVPAGKRTLSAISGGTFEAPMEDHPFSLLVPAAAIGDKNSHFRPVAQEGINRFEFELISPETLAGLSRGELRQCLINTINLHQEEILGVPVTLRDSVATVFDKVQQLDNLHLSAAQQELLGSARLYLVQMGFSEEAGSPLSHALDKLEEADRLRAQAREERLHEFGDAKESERDAVAMESRGVESLRKIIVTDVDVQRRMSSAMARRIEQEQYQSDSIPFELFQNADDAYLDCGTDVEKTPVFVAHFGEGEAVFGHLGRPINQASKSEDAIVRRQRRDLVKMLILHGSEKSHSEDLHQTGKFGLGFKSVFLVCHNPEVVSGELAFEIVGGFYPKRLSSERLSNLREWLSNHLPTPDKGTVIHLGKNRNQPLLEHRFRNLAPFLPVFAKAIREVRLVGEETHLWKPETLRSGDDWSVKRGTIRVEGAEREILVITGQRVSWLFGAEGQRLVSLAGLPCLWITAPTMESNDLGFALNGPFDPDPGRTRLTTSEGGRQHNAALFAEASHLLEAFLRWRLDDGASRQEFAESCWRLFGRPALHSDLKDGRNAFLMSIWTKDQGYRAVLDSEKFLPNGLQGGLFRLTQVPSIRFALSGYLDSKPGRAFLEALLEWEESQLADPQVQIRPDEILSAPVASTLALKGVFQNELKELTTVGVLTRLLGVEHRLAPSLAAKLGEFLTEQLLFNSSGDQTHYNWPETEKEGLRNWLRNVQFMNNERAWMGARSLLTVGGGPVETIRAELVPDNKRLNEEYEANPSAIKLFQLCRGEMEVEAQDLATWLSESATIPDGAKMTGAVRFLSSEDPLLSKVANLLASPSRAAILASSAFQLLPDADQNRISNAFQAGDLYGARVEGRLYFDQTEDTDPKWQTAEAIEAQEIIESWDPSAALELFSLSGPLRDLVLPGTNNDQALRDALSSPNSQHSKECWFRLLCLGCALGLPLGRQPLSAIRNLWEEELGDEFWKSLVPINPTDAQALDFGGHMDQIFQAKIHMLFHNQNASGEYADFWRRVFYDFRKIHHFVFVNDLPESILELSGMDGADGNALINFLRNGKIPDDLAGDTTRFRGVLGQSVKTPLLFLLRELRRLGVLDRNEFNPACMYMNAPARRVARRLGWIDEDSVAGGDFGDLVSMGEQVYEHLEAELPELAPYFDLSLQLYAHKNFV